VRSLPGGSPAERNVECAPSGQKRVASFGVEITRAIDTPIARPFGPGSRVRAVRTLSYRTEVLAR